MQIQVHRQLDVAAGPSTLTGAYLRNPQAFVKGGPSNLPDASRRFQVAQAMEGQYARFGLEAPAALKRLREGAPVWTAGHQLVAAGGPAFFHYKILSMVRRAQLQSNRPVLVFWLASEDHDWEEVRHFPTVCGKGKGFAWAEGAAGGAVGRWRLDDGAREVLKEWAEAARLPDEWRQGLEVDFAQSSTLAEAVFRSVHRWFGTDQVLVLDADDRELKRLAAPLWAEELAGRGISKAVLERTAALEAQGWHPQLMPREVSLFELRQGARIRLEANESGVQPVDGAWQLVASDAKRAAVQRAADWSPNAALRPLYQEFLLSSEVVFLGPSELAYWLQLTDAFAGQNLPIPRLELRDGALWLTPEQFGWMQSTGWHPQSGRSGIEKWWQDRCASEALKFLPEWNFEALASQFATRVAPLDPTLEGAARASVKKMEKAFEGAASKVRRAWRAQHAAEAEFMHSLAEQVAPQGTPQERAEHVAAVAEALGGWEEFKAAWMEVGLDEPVFIVWGA